MADHLLDSYKSRLDDLRALLRDAQAAGDVARYNRIMDRVKMYDDVVIRLSTGLEKHDGR